MSEPLNGWPPKSWWSKSWSGQKCGQFDYGLIIVPQKETEREKETWEWVGDKLADCYLKRQDFSGQK
jgi:hypothetical protein